MCDFIYEYDVEMKFENLSITLFKRDVLFFFVDFL